MWTMTWPWRGVGALPRILCSACPVLLIPFPRFLNNMPAYARQRTDALHIFAHPPDHGLSLLRTRALPGQRSRQSKPQG